MNNTEWWFISRRCARGGVDRIFGRWDSLIMGDLITGERGAHHR